MKGVRRRKNMEKIFNNYNALWEEWKKQDIVTKWDMFMMFSKGHNKKKEFVAYDDMLRQELNEKYGYNNDYVGDKISDKVMEFNRRCAAPFFNQAANEYKLRFFRAIGKLESLYGDLHDKYGEDLTMFNYRDYFNKYEKDVVNSYIFDRNNTADEQDSGEHNEGYFTL